MLEKLKNWWHRGGQAAEQKLLDGTMTPKLVSKNLGQNSNIDAFSSLLVSGDLGSLRNEVEWLKTLGFNQDREIARYQEFVQRWGFQHLGRIADAGSGMGRWSFFLAAVNDHVIGYELNEKWVDLSRRIAARLPLKNITFEKADIAEMAVVPASFEGVWCFNALHVMDRANALRKFNHMLGPGGKIAILSYNGLGNVIEKLRFGLKTGGLDHPMTKFALRSLKGGPLNNSGGNFASLNTLSAVLNEFGFKLIAEPTVAPVKATRPDIPKSELNAFVQAIETEEGFRADFITNGMFKEYPVNFSFVALKEREL